MFNVTSLLYLIHCILQLDLLGVTLLLHAPGTKKGLPNRAAIGVIKSEIEIKKGPINIHVVKILSPVLFAIEDV